MRDAISIPRVNLLHPAIRIQVAQIIGHLEAAIFPSNVKIRIVQGLRTIEEQNALYAIGRTLPGNRVTNAKGGSSYHNYGLAFDFAIMYDKDNNGDFETLSWDTTKDFDSDGEADWMEVVNKFEDEHFDWGGRWTKFQDNPHIEKRFSYHWKELLAKYQNKNFIPGTQYVLV